MEPIIRKLISSLITLLIVAAISFTLFQWIPGTQVEIMLGMDADEAAIEELSRQMALNQPVVARFFMWISGIARGDFGQSIIYRQNVLHLVADSFPPTFSLTLVSSIMILICSIPLGLIASRFKNRWIDRIITLTSQIGIVLPSFWLGILLLRFFSLQWDFFPASGYIPFHTNPSGWWNSVFLPSLALSLIGISVMLRILRGSILDIVHEDYIRTARAKGLPEHKVAFRHILKNALLPFITQYGLQISSIMAGTILIENVFSIPGTGRLLWFAVQRRDLPLVQGCVIWIAFLTIIIHLVTDILHTTIDPRIERV